MRGFICLLILCAVGYGLWWGWHKLPADNPIRVFASDATFKVQMRAEGGATEMRETLNEEVRFYRDAVRDAESQMRTQRKNAPICPRTGRPREVVFTNDPRPVYQEKIRDAQERLRQLSAYERRHR